jgi:hypothetical protein
MEIREHGEVNLQNLLRVLSEILSDRHKVRITVIRGVEEATGGCE